MSQNEHRDPRDVLRRSVVAMIDATTLHAIEHPDTWLLRVSINWVHESGTVLSKFISSLR